MTGYYTTRNKNTGSNGWQKTKSFFCQKQKLLGIVSGALFLGLLFVYIIQMNAMTEQGFKIRQLSKETDQLSLANKKLGLQLVEQQSMVNLSSKIKDLNFVSANEIKYVSSLSVSLAKR